MNKRGFTIRVGPVAMSLVAAAVTAVAFAAISLADSGTANDNGGKDTQTFNAPAPPGGGAGVRFFAPGNLSDADKQKLEDFRNCMEENGAPAPPDPGDIDPSDGPPKPPSATDQEKLQKAWEACKDKLPEDMQNAGPPQVRIGGCAPPGAPGTEQGNKQNQDQSNDSSSDSSSSNS
jgi:hypothetical protein